MLPDNHVHEIFIEGRWYQAWFEVSNWPTQEVKVHLKPFNMRDKLQK